MPGNETSRRSGANGCLSGKRGTLPALRQAASCEGSRNWARAALDHEPPYVPWASAAIARKRTCGGAMGGLSRDLGCGPVGIAARHAVAHILLDAVLGE